jgi:ferrous iron transport protein B
MNILLVGNPNVGKSAIFTHLTGINVVTSNYPGTTVQYSKGSMLLMGGHHTVVDVPGMYRLNPQAEAEKVAVRMIDSGDVLVNVVDATNLERNLNLTLQLMELGKPMVLALNMWDDARRKGIEIDAGRLEQLLKIPVIPTNGITGEGLKLLQEQCIKAKPVNRPRITSGRRWENIGQIISGVQNLSHRHRTFIEAVQDFMIHPFFGAPVAIVALYLVFRFIIAVGEFLTEYILELFQLVYLPIVMGISGLLGGEGIIHSLLIGEIVDGALDFEGAMGVLTTGVFVIFGIVLPYIILFYMVFGFIEDLGYLPRVAVILDRLLHRIGLHGYSFIPMLLACGCNVPGVLAIRNLDTRRERFITAVVTSITIPCMAQTALIIRAVGQWRGLYLGLTFMTLLTVWFVLGLFLKQMVKGTTPTLLMEVPPYRLPSCKVQIKKLKMRIECFLKEAVPYVFGGILFINLFHVTGVIKVVGNLFSPLVRGIFGLPEETVSALIIGTVRKDAAIALLEPIGLNASQTVIAAVILTLYFPCIATFTVLLKELGIADTVRAVGIMFMVTIVTAGALNFLTQIGLTPGILIAGEIILILVCTVTVPLLFKGFRVSKEGNLEAGI